MSITEEFEVIDLTKEASLHALQINENENAKLAAQNCIIKADAIMKKNIQDVFRNYGLETLISFAETALKIPLPDGLDLATEYLDMFFKMINNKGQFFVRALILKATLKSNEAQKKGLKAMDNVNNAKEAIKSIFEAIKVITKEEAAGKKPAGGAGDKGLENKKNYSFLIYNISVCVYNIIRPFFRKGWLNYFLNIVEEIDALLDTVEEPNQDWRAR
jgi:hypothetical protein